MRDSMGDVSTTSTVTAPTLRPDTAYRAGAVAEAERRLTAATDRYMHHAAHALALAAVRELRATAGRTRGRGVLLLVGGGHNGGDALLAGAVLWLSRKAELTPPAWCLDTSRRLLTFYFGGVKSRVLMQYQFWTTPLQFRYFNLLCGLGFVDRASMPPEWRPGPCRWELEWAERRAAERERRRSAAFRENVSQNTTSE